MLSVNSKVRRRRGSVSVTMMLGALVSFSAALLAQSCIAGGPAASELCVKYCDVATQNCQGDQRIFPDRQACEDACSMYPTNGNDDDVKGDTVQCRIKHLEFAADDAITHCMHGSPEGGNVCVTTIDLCARYCTLIAETCTADATRQYASTDECKNACQTFKQNGMDGATDGDTVQCRSTYLNDTPKELSPAEACKAAGLMSSTCIDM